MKKLFHLFLISVIITTATLPVAFSQATGIPWLKYVNDPSVDSILNTLTLKQMVGQCMWVAAWADKSNDNMKEIEDLVVNQGIGGVIFFEGAASIQAGFTARLDSIARIPLIIAQDAEWGLGMRMNEFDDYPWQMTLGAVQNDSMIYYMGKAVAMECRRIGVNLNLAPVSDVNNNPLNPVINYRSLGEDPVKVARKAVMYMKGMQDNGIMASAKHFPGHGDTDTDSHLGIPVIDGTRERFDTVELVPFRALIDNGVGTIMTSHIVVPGLDSLSRRPATFSYTVLTDLLKNEMGFRGLVLTDAMNMAAATMTYPSGKADAEAFIAGNDVIEYSTDPVMGINEIIERVSRGEIAEDDVRERCRKVLAAKHWLSLQDTADITLPGAGKLTQPSSLALIRDLYSSAMTVIENNNNLIPIGRLDKIKIATVAVNRLAVTEFQKLTGRYTNVDNYFIDPDNADAAEFAISRLSDYDIVIAGISGLDQKPSSSFGVTPALKTVVNKLAALDRSVIIWFGNPYGIERLSLTKPPSALIVAYQDNSYTHQAAVQVIFGALGASGRLPVTINSKYPEGYGIKTPGSLRLQYGLPENAGMSSELLNSKVDSVVKAGLDSMAYPGCQVILARKGIVVLNKCYGFHKYDSTEAVTEDDLWDLASVTKISAATPSLMLLNDRGLFSPDAKLGTYLPWYRFSDKGDMLLRDMLAHQAGLTSWIPFWRSTVNEDNTLKSGIYSDSENRKFALPVTDSLYINRHYQKEIFREIRDSKTGEKKYVYSDLTFILAAEIIESLTDTTIDRFAPVNIYRPIGAFNITFNPLGRYPKSQIVPTEYDSLFRKQQIRGSVHDEAAAMLGGVSGHAGLFATGNDLMKLMEMYRRGGEYGGVRILSPEVLKEYTTVQFPENDNRRGLGFDKPMLPNDTIPPEELYPCKSAPPSSFGHAGFTGTFVWIDPDAELTFVFMSNRVYPTRNNSRLYDLRIRNSILETAYASITDKRYY